MTTVWLANTASLLLPVSNLTNLLAMDRVALSTHEVAARKWLPQAASIAVTMAFLWVSLVSDYRHQSRIDISRRESISKLVNVNVQDGLYGSPNLGH